MYLVYEVRSATTNSSIIMIQGRTMMWWLTMGDDSRQNSSVFYIVIPLGMITTGTVCSVELLLVVLMTADTESTRRLRRIFGLPIL